MADELADEFEWKFPDDDYLSVWNAENPEEYLDLRVRTLEDELADREAASKEAASAIAAVSEFTTGPPLAALVELMTDIDDLKIAESEKAFGTAAFAKFTFAPDGNVESSSTAPGSEAVSSSAAGRRRSCSESEIDFEIFVQSRASPHLEALKTRHRSFPENSKTRPPSLAQLSTNTFQGFEDNFVDAAGISPVPGNAAASRTAPGMAAAKNRSCSESDVDFDLFVRNRASGCAPEKFMTRPQSVPAKSKTNTVVFSTSCQPSTLVFQESTETSSFSSPQLTKTGSLFFPHCSKTSSPRPIDTGSIFFSDPKETSSPKPTNTSSLFFPEPTDTSTLFFPQPSKTSSLFLPQPTETSSLFFPEPTETHSLSFPFIPTSKSLASSYNRSLSFPEPSETRHHSLAKLSEIARFPVSFEDKTEFSNPPGNASGRTRSCSESVIDFDVFVQNRASSLATSKTLPQRESSPIAASSIPGPSKPGPSKSSISRVFETAKTKPQGTERGTATPKKTKRHAPPVPPSFCTTPNAIEEQINYMKHMQHLMKEPKKKSGLCALSPVHLNPTKSISSKKANKGKYCPL